jgi:hypothetical protein
MQVINTNDKTIPITIPTIAPTLSPESLMGTNSVPVTESLSVPVTESLSVPVTESLMGTNSKPAWEQAVFKFVTAALPNCVVCNPKSIISA